MYQWYKVSKNVFGKAVLSLVVEFSGRPIHRFADALADGTIGFFQTIGRWFLLKIALIFRKNAGKKLVWENFLKSKNGARKIMLD